MGLPLSSVRKGLFIALAVLASVLLVGLAARAAGDWQSVGATAGGDQILVSSVTAARKNGLRSAWVRVEYKEPVKLPVGGPFVELRARVRFNCSDDNAVPGVVANSEWFYSRDRGGQLVVSKKTRRDDQFGQAPEGNFGEIARDFVCRQK
jgi:hypothetical protein